MQGADFILPDEFVCTSTVGYEKVNNESEVDKTVYTHLENDRSNPYCY